MCKYFERPENANYAPSSTVGHGYTGWLMTCPTSLGLVITDLKIITLFAAAGPALGNSWLTSVLSPLLGLGQILGRDLNFGLAGRDAQQGFITDPLSYQTQNAWWTTRIYPRHCTCSQFRLILEVQS